jgi:hypothetical protein
MIDIEELEADVIAHQLSISIATVSSPKKHTLELLCVRLSANPMALAWIFTLSLLEYGPYCSQMETIT